MSFKCFLNEQKYAVELFEQAEKLSESMVRASSLNKAKVDIKLFAALAALSKINGMKNISIDELNWVGKMVMPDGKESSFAVDPKTGEINVAVIIPQEVVISGTFSDIAKKVKNSFKK